MKHKPLALSATLRLPLIVLTAAACFGVLLSIVRTTASSQPQEPATVTFAAIGDFGSNDANEQDVALLIKSWNPDFIITLGDNNYPDGEASTIDGAIGKYFHEYIYPYRGSYGAGSTTNRFWPSIGNRDWDNQNGAKLQPYLDYFTLPNNERYYDIVRGPVHLFAIDSDADEPDGITSTSVQAQWLRNKLAASTAPWKIVYLHHPPYSSRTSWSNLQWPFAAWGADAVLSGHAHVYERVMKDGIPFITNGLGGDSTGSFTTAIPGSVVRFGDDYGAMRITANANAMTFEFITRRGVVVDSYTTGGQQPPSPTPTPSATPSPSPTPTPLTPAAPSNLTAVAAGSSQINLSWVDNANNENGFRLERCTSASCSNFAQIVQLAANVTTFSDSGLSSNTTYRYRVRAYNADGNSAYSNTREATTTNVGASFGAPGNLVAVGVSNQQIDLTWQDNSTIEAGFKLYRSADNITFSRIATLDANVTSFSNTGRSASTTYYYKIFAFYGSANTAYSNTASATTLAPATVKPATPSNLAAVALSPTQIKLTWTDNANNETGVRVYRSLDGVTFTEITKINLVNVNTFTNTGLTSNTTYYYRLRSYNDAGNSGYSNTASRRTP
ncbi:MAG TPA: fibronectin type III domain-containing protein [Pyrinomonadaceae bacterium]|nr:fibronectin type III domain-containing protein [Pyrinomonadaceae bacterium]